MPKFVCRSVHETNNKKETRNLSVYTNFGAITNVDIRQILGLDESEKVKGSRIIKDTLDTGLIKLIDSKTAPRYMKYILH